MKCATYLRVSTGEQTVEPQRRELGEYLGRRGWTLVEEVVDVISGRREVRTGLERLMGLVEERAIGAVLVVKLDRLGRSLQHVARIIGVLEKRGVALVIPGQGIDTSDTNPAGKLQMHVLAAVAEFERAMISERTKAGLAVVKARGVKLGHPSTRLPANWVEIVARWKAETGGLGLRELRRRLNGVSLSTAARLAKAAGQDRDSR